MKASTHTEIYRRFQGELKPARSGAFPLAASGIRVALKQRWPWLLYLPPLIATVIFSFVVYSKFALEQGVTPSPLGGPDAQTSAAVTAIGGMASQMIQVRDMIVGFVVAMAIFSLLIAAWYGSGLIAEDRRAGAHLLYFARPLSKCDYLLGKLLVVGAFVIVSVLAPGLMICAVATVASPDWSFLKQEGGMFLRVIAFALVHTLVLGSIALAISSLASRKTFALVGILGYFMLSQGVGVLLGALQHDWTWLAISPLSSLRRVAGWIFGVRRVPGVRLEWDVSWSWGLLATVVIVSWLVLAARVRRMEAVA